MKQCAGCGAQMGSRSRYCSACGRGSLLLVLGQTALLGVLLLGIGITSGLVSLQQVERAIGVRKGSVPVTTDRVAPPPPRVAEGPGRAKRREPAGAPLVAATRQANRKTLLPTRRVQGSGPCVPADSGASGSQPTPPDSGLAATNCGAAAGATLITATEPQGYQPSVDSGSVFTPDPAPPDTTPF